MKMWCLFEWVTFFFKDWCFGRTERTFCNLHKRTAENIVDHLVAVADNPKLLPSVLTSRTTDCSGRKELQTVTFSCFSTATAFFTRLLADVTQPLPVWSHPEPKPNWGGWWTRSRAWLPAGPSSKCQRWSTQGYGAIHGSSDLTVCGAIFEGSSVRVVVRPRRKEVRRTFSL